MLQLIGWLGCIYLIVKVLGYTANPAFRKEDGTLNESAKAAVWIGWLAAIGFGFLFLGQGSSMNPTASTEPTMLNDPARSLDANNWSQAKRDCMGDPQTTYEQCEGL